MIGTIRQLNPETKKWENYYPRTYGYLINGTVNDSDKLGGKHSSSYMPSTFSSYMEVKGEDKKYKGIVCSKLYIGQNNKITSLTDNQAWIEGKLYINNGEEVATKTDLKTLLDDVNSKMTSLETTVSQRAIVAEKLATPFRINGIECDGSRDITIPVPSIAIQPSKPTSGNQTLWINTAEGTLHYYYKGLWKQLCINEDGEFTI